MDLIAYAIPFFILAMIAELAWGLYTRRNTYRVNDAVGSLFLGTLSQTRRFVTLGIGGLVYHWISEYAALDMLSASSVWTWVLAMVLYDFCYYWLHRIGHERSLLWAAHVAHHQSEDYNLSTALRQTSTGFLFGWLFYIPMYVVGIPAEVVVTVGSINLIYQFWVHTQHIGKLGWYEWIFVTPSNHRVHHAQNAEYLDRNYGGLFIIWDRIFGTFQEEQENNPPIYGIRGALRSFNPAKALTHIYVDMFRDSWHTRCWRDKLHVWVARTGWRPEDVAASMPRSKTDLDHFERFDPVLSTSIQVYAVFQLVAVVALLVYLQIGIAGSYTIGVGLALAMLLITMTTACWLDGKTRVRCVAMDAARLAIFSLCLMFLPDQLEAMGFSSAATVYTAINAAFLFYPAVHRALTRETPLAA